MASVNNRFAIFFLRFGFTLFLPFTISAADEFAAKFTTRPKNKEVFFGDSVVFDWDYQDVENQVESVKFGITRGIAGDKLVTLVRKMTKGIVYKPNKNKQDLIERTNAVSDQKSSFRITKVNMSDTGRYFCTLSPTDLTQKTLTEYVSMKVVDLQINKNISKKAVDSWKNQKTSLVCMVRVVKGQPVTFTWQRQPNNHTMSRTKSIDTRTESVLNIFTVVEQDFTTYTCIAKTESTTKFHDVVVRQLFEPGPPENLQKKAVFIGGDTHPHVYWQKPKHDGGAKIIKYLVEYKPKGIAWSKSTRVATKITKFTKFNLKEGKQYDVRVLASNKVGKGKYSNEVEIQLGDYLKPEPRSNSSGTCRVQYMWWSYLVSLVTLVITTK